MILTFFLLVRIKGAFTRYILAKGRSVPGPGRAFTRFLNIGSHLTPSLAQVEHRVAVLNMFLLRPQGRELKHR